MISNHIAIHDRELLKTSSFQIEIFELCTLCGARFGIGYFGPSVAELHPSEVVEELPRKFTEILTKDHRQERQHRNVIDLNY